MDTDQIDPDLTETTLRNKAEAAATTAREAVTDTLSRGEQYVRDRPWPTVGGAFVLGLVLGALLFRRSPEPSALERTSHRLEKALASLSNQLPSGKKLQSLAHDLPSAGASLFADLGKKFRAW